MRYGVAIICAIIGAGLAATLLGSPLASWAVSNMSFNSPVAADDMHGWIYLGSMAAGVILGWMLGWAIGGRLKEEELDI